LFFTSYSTAKKLFPLETKATDQAQYAKDLLLYIRKRAGFTDEMLQRPSTINAALWSIMARSLRADPKQRQRTAGELAAELRRYLETGQGVDTDLDDEKTGVANVADFLAAHKQLFGEGRSALMKHPAAASSAQTAPSNAAVDSGATEIAQPVDVAAIQAYRQERLNAKPASPFAQTMTPGQMQAAVAQIRANQGAGPAVVPSAPSPKNTDGISSSSVPPQTNAGVGNANKPATQTKGKFPVVAIVVIVLLILAGVGVTVVMTHRG